MTVNLREVNSREESDDEAAIEDTPGYPSSAKVHPKRCTVPPSGEGSQVQEGVWGCAHDLGRR